MVGKKYKAQKSELKSLNSFSLFDDPLKKAASDMQLLVNRKLLVPFREPASHIFPKGLSTKFKNSLRFNDSKSMSLPQVLKR